MIVLEEGTTCYWEFRFDSMGVGKFMRSLGISLKLKHYSCNLSRLAGLNKIRGVACYLFRGGRFVVPEFRM